jgi:hypothetical protein
MLLSRPGTPTSEISLLKQIQTSFDLQQTRWTCNVFLERRNIIYHHIIGLGTEERWRKWRKLYDYEIDALCLIGYSRRFVRLFK